MHLDVLKRFLTFKIDMHTLGTKKTRNSATLRVKNEGKRTFFQYISLYLGFVSVKIYGMTILIIPDLFVEDFIVIRPDSARK